MTVTELCDKAVEFYKRAEIRKDYPDDERFGDYVYDKILAAYKSSYGRSSQLG